VTSTGYMLRNFKFYKTAIIMYRFCDFGYKTIYITSLSLAPQREGFRVGPHAYDICHKGESLWEMV